jgi:hypothetical protein
MPFGTITAQTLTYEPRKPGVYERAGLALGSPSNEFRMSGANASAKQNKTVAVTRVLAKDVVVGGSTVRKNAVAVLNITFPNDTTFTAAELDSLVADISEFLTTATLARLSAGEV